MTEPRLPEPWLRGTLTDFEPVQRAVIHALELAREDIEKWCGNLTDAQLNARPYGLAPVAFHIRHISRSIDRLLTYAQGHDLSADQLAALKSELDSDATHVEVFREFETELARSVQRIGAFDADKLDGPRNVGRKQMPTTVGGLLVHVADHTQRHVGQAITTAKVVLAQS
jgi:uncharacterized damage-inducible protein DinB